MICMYCDEINCANRSHIESIDVFHNEIVQCCVKAADEAFAHQKNSNRTSFPGWSMYVSEYKRDALFWHNK